jgi:hypothetical protein
VEHQELNPGDGQYPKRLVERMGDEAPRLYFNGPLKLLNRCSMGVICADMIPGLCMYETNDMLFEIREWALNYIGGWHSVMETEIFRLALYRKNDPEGLRSATLVSARGLARENWDDFLNDRFGYSGPFRDFPEKPEYYRRAKAGELLMLSITEPDLKRQLRKNIMARNWLVCALADVVFVPFAEKGTKTYTNARRVVEAGIPVFTSEREENKDLHDLGVPALNRQTVGDFLGGLGAHKDGEPPFLPPAPQKPQPSVPAKKPKRRAMQTSFILGEKPERYDPSGK